MMLASAIDYIHGIATNRTGDSYPTIDNDASAVVDATAAVAGVFLLGAVFGIVLSSMGKTILMRSSVKKTGEKADTKKDEGYQVLEGAISLFAEKQVLSTNVDKSNVVNYISPEEMLSKLFSKNSSNSMDLSSDFSQSKDKVGQMLQCFSDLQKYSVNTNHPFFFNQLFGALDPVALAAEIIATGMNTSAYTYETAPVFTMIERDLFSNLGRIVFPQSEACDGLMLPGGSLSNLTALHVARHFATRGASAANTETTAIDNNAFEEEKKDESKHESERGCQVSVSTSEPPQLVAFVSAEAHYSFEKAVSVIGLGRENLIKVPTKQNGEIDVEQLDLIS
jgi:hypothetical protein